MTRFTGHCVSSRIAAELDGLTRGVVDPPVQENRTPPATAIAERSRKRRRLIGLGCGSSVIARERTGGSLRIHDGRRFPRDGLLRSWPRRAAGGRTHSYAFS